MDLKSLKGPMLYAIGLSLAPCLKATSHEEELRKLDEKKAELNLRENLLESIGRSHGVYKLVRDSKIGGEHGISTRSRDWYNQCKEWLSNMDGLLATAVRAQSLGSQQAQEKAKEITEKLLSGWAKIKASKEELRGEIESVLTTLDQNPPPKSYTVREYQSNLDAFYANIDFMRHTLDKALALIESRNDEEWLRILEETQVVIKSLIKLGTLNANQLKSALAEIDEYHRAQKIYQIEVSELTDLQDSIKRFISQGRVFEAEHAYELFSERTHQALGVLQANHIDPSFRRSMDDRIARLKSAVDKFIESSFGLMSKQKFYFRSYSANLKKLARDCRNDLKRQELNCELLGEIVTIPETKVKALSEPELRELDKLLIKVRKGPLSGNLKL